MGLSLCWMVEGMNKNARLISIDQDPLLIEILRPLYQLHQGVSTECCEAGSWINAYDGPGFDLIFANTWPGKYSHLSHTLSLLNPGGIYVVDDLLPQSNLPKGHQKNVDNFLKEIEHKTNLTTVNIDYSTGILIATKTAH